MHFGAVKIALTAIAIVLAIYAMRIILTRFVFINAEYSLRDTALTSMMAPKGLAAAVLAALPLHYGVPGGEAIRETTYMVVLFSITLTALLVMAYRHRWMQRGYALLIGKAAPEK